MLKPYLSMKTSLCLPRSGFEQLCRISEIAKMLRVSRGSVYNLLRGERIIDLGGKNKRGCKLVPASVLRAIIARRIRVFR
jgi:hypothetical protein